MHLLAKVGPGLLRLDPHGILLRSFGQKISIAIKQTRETFLLGKELDEAELRSWIKGLCRLEQAVIRVNGTLG